MRSISYTFEFGVNKTQCKQKCKLDTTNTYCLGCFRTIEEIKKKGLEYNGQATRTRND